ncbi:hypothetical protein BDZ89DRAFT_1087630, partial [Hymenopellis radicata]
MSIVHNDLVRFASDNVAGQTTTLDAVTPSDARENATSTDYERPEGVNDEVRLGIDGSDDLNANNEKLVAASPSRFLLPADNNTSSLSAAKCRVSLLYHAGTVRFLGQRRRFPCRSSPLEVHTITTKTPARMRLLQLHQSCSWPRLLKFQVRHSSPRRLHHRSTCPLI